MISTHFKGRLGNNMYQYAHIRTASGRLGFDFSIHSDINGFKQFDDIFPHLIFKRNEGHFDTKLEEYNYDFKENFYNLKDNTIVSGFFQNYLYFNRNDVKEWYQIYLNEDEKLEFDRLYNKYDVNEYCYMNFRGTDFMDVPAWQTQRDFFKRSQKLSNKSKFLVITDDIENAKLNIDADDYIDPNFKIGLKLMTLSKILIIPGWTTFAWWGGWLSNADLVIAPDINDICYIKNNVFKYI